MATLLSGDAQSPEGFFTVLQRRRHRIAMRTVYAVLTPQSVLASPKGSTPPGEAGAAVLPPPPHALSQPDLQTGWFGEHAIYCVTSGDGVR